MKIIYISDDGKVFEDRCECEDYEWKLAHPYLDDVYLYDIDNNRLEDVLSEDTYYITEKIVVQNENALKDLRALANYTGFCCYFDVKECGEWVFNMDKQTYIKI